MQVYVLRNKANGKRYVGQTIQTIQRRLNGHYSEARIGKNRMPIGAAIKKHGKDAFELEQVIKCSSVEEMNRIEVELIAQLRTCDRTFGYNVERGGCEKTELDRQRQSAIMKAKYSDPKQKARISAHRRKYFSNPEARKAASLATLSVMGNNLKQRISDTVSRQWQLKSQIQRLNDVAALKKAQSDFKLRLYTGQTVEVKMPDGSQISIPRVDFWEWSKNQGLNPTSAGQALRQSKTHKGYGFTLLRKSNE